MPSPECYSEVTEDYFGNGKTVCPRRASCSSLLQTSGYESSVQEPWPSLVAIASCSLSVLGSLLIIYTHARWRDMRTGSRSIITYLALADLVTALGYVGGSANYMVHFGEREDTEQCRIFHTLCQIQSFITSTSSLWSFAWTFILALYLYLVIARDKMSLANKLIPLFHVVAWTTPLLITLPLLVTGKLGYSPYAASNWCYIRDYLPGDNHKYLCGQLNYEVMGLVLVGGKAWEIATYVLIILLYAAIKWHIHKETSDAGSYHFVGDLTLATVRRADKKLTFIPVVFILLRIWGTAQFIYATALYRVTFFDCVPSGYAIGFTFFAYMQAVGDGGQGWGNVILYILSSPKIRHRLWHCLTHPSWSNLVGQRKAPPSGDIRQYNNQLDGRRPSVSVNNSTSFVSTN